LAPATAASFRGASPGGEEGREGLLAAAEDFAAVFLAAPEDLLAAVDFFAALAEDFFAVDFFAADLFAVAEDFAAEDFFAAVAEGFFVDFFAADFFAGPELFAAEDLFAAVAEDVLAVDFFAAPEGFAAVVEDFFAAPEAFFVAAFFARPEAARVFEPEAARFAVRAVFAPSALSALPEVVVRLPPAALPSRLLERRTGRDRGRLEKTSVLESSAIG
jgi:hypothetical protein